MKSTLRIALPKGRMSEESLAFLRDSGITGLKSFDDDRKLIFRDTENDLEFYLIRSKDVGTYVERGAADLGVMGLDLLEEHRFEVFVPLALPFGQCSLCIAYPDEKTDWNKSRHLTVATKYPQLTGEYFFEHGYNVRIINLYGSIEIAPLTGLSDVIVDLVSSGATLKANKLTRGPAILESSARLILNPSASVWKKDRLDPLLDRLLKFSKAS